MKMLMVKIIDFIIYNCIYLYHVVSDMRKACSRDVKQKSVIPLIHPVRPEDVD